MKIAPQNNIQTNVDQLQNNKTAAVSSQQASKSAQTSGSAAGGDSTSFSASASQLSQLRSQLDQAPDVRADKVSSLQSSISNGTYNVSSSDIANAIASTPSVGKG